VNEHRYPDTDGVMIDKRAWSIGTAIAVHLSDGYTLAARTSSVPRLDYDGTWRVRVVGRAAPVPLAQCVAQVLPTLRRADPEGNSGSEKEITSAEQGSPRG